MSPDRLAQEVSMCQTQHYHRSKIAAQIGATIGNLEDWRDALGAIAATVDSTPLAARLLTESSDHYANAVKLADDARRIAANFADPNHHASTDHHHHTDANTPESDPSRYDVNA